MDDPESTMATVANFVEQLHANLSSPVEKETITARLLGIARRRKDARAIIGSHAQAMPLFISILRNGTPLAKVNVASTLSVLCKDEDLRLKVLLGGCIPPFVSEGCTIKLSQVITNHKLLLLTKKFSTHSPLMLFLDFTSDFHQQ